MMPTGYTDPAGTTKVVQRKGTLYRMVKTATGWAYEHRMIAARLLGRPLRADEVVHHRNRNGLDNAPENLEVLTKAAHNQEHLQITTWAKNYPACRECGATHRKHLGDGLCSRCYQRQPGKGWKDWRDRHACRI